MPDNYVILPAQPGWYVLCWTEAAGEPEDYLLEPIVAWRVETTALREGELCSWADPVTCGVEDERIKLEIAPDGKVLERGTGQWWQSISHWIGYQKGQQAKMRRA